jgi:heme O synthase-like polyprenyltransferase
VVLLRNRNPRAPIDTFKYSIVYLMALFVVLLVDHYIPYEVPAGMSAIPTLELTPL